MKVKLFFEVFKDREIEEKVKDFEIIRLKCFIQFKTENGWSKPYDAIVDTGAPTSLIPHYIWNKVEHIFIADHQVQGISSRPECAVPVKIGKVSCVLFDEEGNQTRELKIHTYLALTSEVPLIIGFKDILSQFSTYFDYSALEAYIEQK
jgi:hypothetical protein